MRLVTHVFMISLLVAVTAVLPCYAAATPPSAEPVTGQQTHKPDAATVWIDVRSVEEFNAGHLPGAVNIVHTDIAQGIVALELDKATPIALYCKSGRRAGIALEALQKLGYTQVSNQGGYEQLKQEHTTEHERQ